ncbi:alkyl/aryl-sulfatase [Beduini massiliensis]|uniref:alkyl/aryl-sulfatase n=1 Tax=Beduini massiliensis TaxID=1585974 RepID=UPI00059AB639|nr:alkyl/aryl-sulfatase [Beduini massiliensis]
MFEKNGEERLRLFSETAYPYEIKKINDRIYHVVGLGHSNSIAIEGKTSWILVDTLDSDQRALRMKAELAKIADKPVKTIIFTHSHYDHHGGSGAFKDTVEEIIAFKPKKTPLKYYNLLDDVLQKRTSKQFGYALSDEECMTQGIGIREGRVVNDGTGICLDANVVYDQDIVEREIDGVKLQLVLAVGETDDQIFVWLPEDKVLCCGDNFYGCFPNLYAIRGSQYRDIAAWVDSLNLILSYPAEVVLPGHTKAIIGQAQVQVVLGNFKDAIEYILLETLKCMNKGMSESETVAAVVLPQKWADLPYLGEFYGTVEWSVRSVYHGYFGWFDGNPTHLAQLSDDLYDAKLLSMIGEEKLESEIQTALKEEQYQMAVQLCDILLNTKTDVQKYKKLKAEGLLGLSKYVTSANARHYYLCSAKELME